MRLVRRGEKKKKGKTEEKSKKRRIGERERAGQDKLSEGFGCPN